MAQSTITSYFSNRKRAAPDDFKLKSKVLVLDQSAAPLGYDANSTDISQPKQVSRKVVMARSKPSNTQGHEPKPSTRVSSGKLIKNAQQPDLTNFFKKPETELKTELITELKTELKTEGNQKVTEASTKPTVPFEMRGPLSPVKRRPENVSDPLRSVKHEVAPPSESQPKESAAEKGRKELSLGEIKSRLNRSSRVAELKEKLARAESGFQKLAEMSGRPDASPRLNKFHTIEVEVPVTPTKSPLTSPKKLLGSLSQPGLLSPSKAYQRHAALAAPTMTSPKKLLDSPRQSGLLSPSKAFQRHAALAALTTPETRLILPYSYRLLAELFRCVDIVVSMMCNRSETVTFKKLKPAVQEMRRRTFTERHLAQMMTVLPNAFAVSQIKMRNFGSMAKEKYEMIVTPLRKSDNGIIPAEPGMMTPAILAERQQDFYKSLLEITKDHHDEFLRALEPPMIVAKERVTRWHPDFPVDKVPEVTPAELPVAPGQEKVSSAKDVLAHARHLFTANPRMAKALETVAAARENTVTVEVVDADSTTPPPPAPVKSNITSALKGIPKALLEKVRARQAAKALDAMTRSAAQDKEVVLYSRLPDIARILRNCYVVEKKGVMPLETVVEKVANSYRNNISRGELEEHLRLLAREVPGWITFDQLRNTDFVRLSKGADMNRVMKKLEALATQKTGISI